jgi:hypothetical protein
MQERGVRAASQWRYRGRYRAYLAERDEPPRWRRWQRQRVGLRRPVRFCHGNRRHRRCGSCLCLCFGCGRWRRGHSCAGGRASRGSRSHGGGGGSAAEREALGDRASRLGQGRRAQQSGTALRGRRRLAVVGRRGGSTLAAATPKHGQRHARERAPEGATQGRGRRRRPSRGGAQVRPCILGQPVLVPTAPTYVAAMRTWTEAVSPRGAGAPATHEGSVKASERASTGTLAGAGANAASVRGCWPALLWPTGVDSS